MNTPSRCAVLASRFRPLMRAALAGALLALLPGCPPAATTKPSARPAATQARAARMITVARRQTSFVPLDVSPDAGAPVRIEISNATGPEPWTPARFTLFAAAPRTGTATGPLVDQLLGVPTAPIDAGTVLAPVPHEDAGDTRTFRLPSPGAVTPTLSLRIEVPALLAPGTYTFPLTFVSALGARHEAPLAIDVSDITLPGEPRVIALATATAAEMAAAYPDTFGPLQATYLDRADPEHAAAIDHLDALVKIAQRNGVSFFIEDMAPAVKIDEVGRVLVEWDAYDRVVGPYLDGSAFADRTSLPVWLAPAPPRRIRDTPTQLRQYLQACAEHHRDKGWTAQPAFMHAALVDVDPDPDLRRQILDVLTRHLDRSFALVATPDVQSAFKPMWVIRDDDPRLPPAGRLASPVSVRAWPWLAAARGLRGFVWRSAVQADQPRALHLSTAGEDPRAAAALLPLFVSPSPAPVDPKRKNKDIPALSLDPSLTLRFAWLTAGLNDTDHFGLLERRGDPAVAQEILAGVVGRTGLGEREAARGSYLYAGWTTDARTWAAVTSMLDRLILASDPGSAAQIPPDDPLLLQTKIWLAQAHRPVARVAGYSFAVTPGRDGTVVDATVDFLLENPIGAPAEMDVKWPETPGDFLIARAGNAPVALPAFAVQRLPLTLSGHVDSIREAPRLSSLEVVERANGARLEFPALVPVYRFRSTREPPKIDGKFGDWPNDAYIQSFGPMRVDLPYQSRQGLLTGRLQPEPDAASVRWSFDNDYIYAMIRCPQGVISDDRSNEWPQQSGRWWGSDVVQLQLAGGARLAAGTRVVQLAVKPSGIVLARAATVPQAADAPLQFTDANLTGLKYALTTDKPADNAPGGYNVELAIPRKWFPVHHDKDPTVPVWRVNVLRHRATDLSSTSWSGPLLDDTDTAMMGALLGGD